MHYCENDMELAKYYIMYFKLHYFDTNLRGKNPNPLFRLDRAMYSNVLNLSHLVAWTIYIVLYFYL